MAEHGSSSMLTEEANTSKVTIVSTRPRTVRTLARTHSTHTVYPTERHFIRMRNTRLCDRELNLQGKMKRRKGA